MAGFKVNFTDEEASSEARDFDALPTGKYYARVTDVSLEECGPNSKNPGKNYYHLEFTVQDGAYEGRKFWTNAMLFEGALYTIAQLMKATGFEAELKKGNIPEGDEFVSKEVIVNVAKQRDLYKEKPENGGDGVTKLWKNEVKGIAKYDGVSPSPKEKVSDAAVKSGAGSLLP